MLSPGVFIVLYLIDMFIEMLNQQFLNLLVLAGFDSVEDLYVFFDIVLSIEGRLLIVVPRQEKEQGVLLFKGSGQLFHCR